MFDFFMSIVIRLLSQKAKIDTFAAFSIMEPFSSNTKRNCRKSQTFSFLVVVSIFKSPFEAQRASMLYVWICSTILSSDL